MNQREILVKSTLDGSMQPSLFYKAEGTRPLLVGLHTWSYDRFNQIENMLPFAEKYDFNLLLPEFRGPNLKTNPICTQACGSEFALGDVKDAIDAVIDEVDKDNILFEKLLADYFFDSRLNFPHSPHFKINKIFGCIFICSL
jgi:hypothetical protein